MTIATTGAKITTNLEWLDAPDGPGTFWAGRPGDSADPYEFGFVDGQLATEIDVSIVTATELRDKFGCRFARYVPPVVPERKEPTP